MQDYFLNYLNHLNYHPVQILPFSAQIEYFFFHLEPLFNVVQSTLDSGNELSLATLLKGMYRIYIFGNCVKENVYPSYPRQLC